MQVIPLIKLSRIINKLSKLNSQCLPCKLLVLAWHELVYWIKAAEPGSTFKPAKCNKDVGIFFPFFFFYINFPLKYHMQRLGGKFKIETFALVSLEDGVEVCGCDTNSWLLHRSRGRVNDCLLSNETESWLIIRVRGLSSQG